jgi:hypothetical protein
MTRSIGFDHVINYEQGDFTKSGKRYDLILDTKTNRSPFAYLRVFTPGGTYVTVGGETAMLFRFLIFSGLIRLLTGKKIVVIKPKQNASGGSEGVFRGGTPGACHRRAVQAERLARRLSPLFHGESRREGDLDGGLTIIWSAFADGSPRLLLSNGEGFTDGCRPLTGGSLITWRLHRSFVGLLANFGCPTNRELSGKPISSKPVI